MRKSPKIVVIGSGFGGFAAAIRLRSRGYDVELVEARDQLGGRAYVYRQNGFTFDGGPTVITAPFLIDEVFQAAGRRTKDYVSMVPVDPFYRIEFHDGRSFEYNGDALEMEQRVAAFSPGDLDGYRRMIVQAKAIFQKGFVELADKPFLRIADMLRIAPDLARLGSHRTVYRFVSRYIKDPMLRRVFSFHPLLVGGNPFQTTSIYALIHYLERQWGVHYAMGGTGSVISAFGRVLEELGAKIRLSSPVAEILIEDGKRPRVAGVQLANGEVIGCDAVVSNADVANTYRKLVPPKFRQKNTDRRMERMRYSMSLFVIYFGTRRKYSEVKHHTIVLSESYGELLNDIFNRKRLPEQVSLYLHRPSATDPSMAPPGCDCFYVLAPVPNQLSGIDWTQQARPFRDRVFQELEKRVMPGLRESVVTERILTPLDFETTLDSFRGAAFSFEPVFSQSAWFRPHNASEDIDHLYFAGAGTHPGAGIPGVLSSAKIVENLIVERLPIAGAASRVHELAEAPVAG